MEKVTHASKLSAEKPASLIKGSHVFAQNFRGTELYFERIDRPDGLNDSDFADKEALFSRLRTIARETMREELVAAIPFYFKVATYIILVRDIQGQVVGITACSGLFDTKAPAVICWVSTFTRDFRGNGIQTCLSIRCLHGVIAQYRDRNCGTLWCKISSLFRTWFIAFRTFNPVVYSMFDRAGSTISPQFTGNGDIKSKPMTAKELSVRTGFLAKLGLTPAQTKNSQLMVVKAFHNDEESRQALSRLPMAENRKANLFFQKYLGVDQGNLLITTLSFRPCNYIAVKAGRKFRADLLSLMKRQRKAIVTILSKVGLSTVKEN